MTLESTVEQFTDEMRTAINSVGTKEIVVKLLSDETTQAIDKTAKKLYISLVVETRQTGFNTQ